MRYVLCFQQAPGRRLANLDSSEPRHKTTRWRTRKVSPGRALRCTGPCSAVSHRSARRPFPRLLRASDTESMETARPPAPEAARSCQPAMERLIGIQVVPERQPEPHHDPCTNRSRRHQIDPQRQRALYPGQPFAFHNPRQVHTATRVTQTTSCSQEYPSNKRSNLWHGSFADSTTRRMGAVGFACLRHSSADTSQELEQGSGRGQGGLR